MISLRQKKLVQKLSKELTVLGSLSLTAPLMCIMLVVGLVVSAQPAPKHIQVRNQAVTYKKRSTHDVAAQPKEVSQTVVTTPQIEAPTAPSSKPTTKVSASTPQTTTSPAEPVVTPSPSSSVSGLTPTTSTPTPAPSSQAPASTPPTTPAVTTSYTSSNWSGYMATTGSYTGISGSWTATNAAGISRTTSADSTWIGIGGVTSGDLIQVGTQNIITASGQVSTSAFYELLPDSSESIASITISPGDSISASLSEVSVGQWTINLADKTDGESYALTVSYASSLSSAEWIEEDPSYSFRQQIPFDNFQEASFTNGSTVAGGITDSISASNAQPVTMVGRSGQTVAAPSVIDTDGASFTITP